MNVADFEDLLDRLGDDIATWPAELRQPVAALLQSSDAARVRLDDARLVRQALTAAPVRADPKLTERILQAARQTPAAAPDAPAAPDKALLYR